MPRHRPRLRMTETCEGVPVCLVGPDIQLFVFYFCCYMIAVAGIDSSSSSSTVKTALSCFRQAVSPSLVPASWAASVPDCSTNGTTPWAGVVCISSASATIAVGGCDSSSSPVFSTWAADGCDLSPIAHLSVCGASVEWNDANFTASVVVFTNCTNVTLRRSTFLSLTIVRSESVVIDSLQFRSLAVETVKIDLRNYTCAKDATDCHLDVRTSGSARIVDGSLATFNVWCSIVHDAEAEGGLELISLSVASVSNIVYIAQRKGGSIVLKDVSSIGGTVISANSFVLLLNASAPNASVSVDGTTSGKEFNSLDATISAIGDIVIGPIIASSGPGGYSTVNIDLASPREIHVGRLTAYGSATAAGAIINTVFREANAASLTGFEGSFAVHATIVITLHHTPWFSVSDVVCPVFHLVSCFACQLVGVRAASLEITQADSASIYSTPSPQLWPAVITLTNCAPGHLIVSRSNGLRSIALSALKYVTVQDCVLANTSGGVVHVHPFQNATDFSHLEPDGPFMFAVNEIDILEFLCNFATSQLFVIDGVHQLTTLRISHNDGCEHAALSRGNADDVYAHRTARRGVQC